MMKKPRYAWSILEAAEKAIERGFSVVWSTPTTLLLDLDNGGALDIYCGQMKRIGALFSLRESDRWSSKSGVGIHVVVACKELSPLERIALQACLGSDPLREALAVRMLADGIANVTCLFRPKLVLS